MHKFKYLGSLFTAKGDKDQDVRTRIANDPKEMEFPTTHVQAGRQNWTSAIRLYSASVWLLYASIRMRILEVYRSSQRRINNANSSMLVSFIHKTIHQETRLVTKIIVEPGTASVQN